MRVFKLPSSRPAIYALGGLGLLLYVFVIGTFAGERWPAVRLAGALMGGSVIVAAVFGVRRQSDAIDRLSLGVVALFLVACLVSTSLRLSLDAAVTAVAVTAAFLASREVLADADARWVFVRVLSICGTSAALAFGLVWLGIWMGWGSAFGWRFAPPLDLPLPSGPFGYRHHVADFVLMCTPAMLIDARDARRLNRLVPMIGLVFGGFVVLAAGSRTIWLACLAAAILTLLSQSGTSRLVAVVRAARHRTPAWTPLAGAALAISAIVVLAGPLAARVLQVSPIEARSEIWSRAVALGVDRPLSGWGPGSFPFLLRRTDYFDFNVFAPRHPDNVFVMALTESGVLGVAGLAAIVAVAAWFIVGRRLPAPTVFGLTFFGAVGLTASPTDYGFLYAPLLGWIAYGVPRTGVLTPRSRLRFAAPGLLVPIGVAFAAMTVAAVAHDAARVQAEAGDYASASENARLAAALDPQLAIYARDLGWLQLAEGDSTDAGRSFGAALDRNPLDTSAMRGAALSALATGSPADAVNVALEAVARHRSDVRNALTAAYVAAEAGEQPTADRMVIEAMQQQPLLVSAPSWATIGFDPASVLERAARSTASGDETPVGSGIPSLRIAWLSALTGETQLRHRAFESAGPYVREAGLLSEFASCELTGRELTDLEPPILPQYWEVRLVLGSLVGSDDPDGLFQSTFQMPSLERRATGGQVDPPLESDGFLDLVGYRRRPIELRESIIDLPTLDAAMMRLLTREPVLGLADRCS